MSILYWFRSCCNSRFCRHDRDCGNLHTHAHTKENSTDEQLPPVPRECLAEYGEDTKETGHKNSTTTADVVVDWVSEHGRYSTDGDRGGRVNHSN